MSVPFAGNAFIDGGQVQNVKVVSSSVGNSIITTSSIDMNLQNITSVKDPINPQDAATKKYVDDLGIVISNVTLNGTSEQIISNNLKGTFSIFVDNISASTGPSAAFIVTKNVASDFGQVSRIAATPGSLSNTTLRLSWVPNSGIYLHKTNTGFDGSYRVKII